MVDYYLQVNQERCIGCEECLPYCGMGAINIHYGLAEIDPRECVECGICLKSGVCPNGALEQQPLAWPRILRQQFSNAKAKHPRTAVAGRGTEEVKTNDVTGRYLTGELGFGIEMGRPGLGVRIKDVEKMASAIAPIGVEWELANPVTALMKDVATGKLQDDVLDEKVLSCIVEFKIPLDKLKPVLHALKQVEKDVETVFSVSMITTFAPDGSLPGLDQVTESGFTPRPNPKVNLGLGKPRFGEDNAKKVQ